MMESALSGRRLAIGMLWFVLATTVAGIAAAWLASSKPIWILFGFEMVIAAGVAVGLAWLRPRNPEAPGLGLVCVAGSIAACTFLSWLAVRNIPLTIPQGGKFLAGWLTLRVGIAAGLSIIGASAVLRRDVRSAGYLMRAVVCAAGFVGVAALVGNGASRRWILDLPGWASFSIGSVAFLAVCVLLSAAVHCAVRAFECGIPIAGPQKVS